MIKVFLREKKLKHGKQGLYLDFYPPVTHPDTRKETRREHLGLYVYERPRNELEREQNKETRMLAESIRSRRQLELQASAYGFVSSTSRKKDFVEHLRKIVETKKKTTSKSNTENWAAVVKHFTEFAGEKLRFANLTEGLCSDFKNYLLDHKNLSRNSAAAYFDKFKAAVRHAHESNLISTNPAKKVKSIKQEDTRREFLTIHELRHLSGIAFKYEDVKRAAIFSALTGLRYSDIKKLTWKEIHENGPDEFSIRFRQQKTKDHETQPISEEAVAILGERGGPDDLIFKDLRYWQCAFLPQWLTAAGITKKITFHCFRHTNATLHLTFGTDIYTLSKMLGHKNVRTTQIYAKVVDEKKRSAAGVIKLAEPSK